jgi:hypothetical protein
MHAYACFFCGVLAVVGSRQALKYVICDRRDPGRDDLQRNCTADAACSSGGQHDLNFSLMNACLNAESLTSVKKRQLEEKNPYLGIDCNEMGGSW